jgi:GGDEF domain-containing protein/EAL domain-containing protein (putative c-di-GMP-specific phosphodiesterase class I)
MTTHAEDASSLRHRLWLLVTLSWLATATLSALLLWSPGLDGLPVEERALVQLIGWSVSFGLVGALLVMGLRRLERWARQPLADFEHQIRQLADRQFVELKQPDVAEWVELSRSINVLVARMRQLLADRDEAVRNLMSRLEHDDLTGVASRDYFMAMLRSGLSDGISAGGVAIVRVHDLDGMNRRVGRSRTDEFLVAVATSLRAKMHRWPDAEQGVLARLNGADFGLYLPGVELEQWRELVTEASQALRALANESFSEGDDVAWIGGTGWLQGETLGDVLGRVDNMLIYAAGRREPVCFAPPAARPTLVTVAQWRVVIEKAIETGHLALKTTPLNGADGHLLHHVGEIQLILPDGTVLQAEEVMPPAVRSGRSGDLDLKLVEMGLRHIRETGDALALPLASQSLARPSTLRRLGELMDRHPDVCGLLALEIQDPAGHDEGVAALKGIARLLNNRPVRLGVNRVGAQAAELPTLHSERISYVKLHQALLTDPDNARHRAHLRHLWRVLRAQKVDVLAEDSQGQYMLRQMLSRSVSDAAAEFNV